MWWTHSAESTAKQGSDGARTEHGNDSHVDASLGTAYKHTEADAQHLVVHVQTDFFAGLKHEYKALCVSKMLARIRDDRAGATMTK